MESFLQQVVNGLTLGGVYSLVALGLTLVYGILHVPNFAHGAFYMTGAFAAFALMNRFGFNYWLAMIGAALAVSVIATVAERLVFHPLRRASELHPMIAAIGLLLFLEAGAQAIWGADFHRLPPPWEGIGVLDRRWTYQVLVLLTHGPRRFRELDQVVPGMSRRMMLERLRDLEAAGLVWCGHPASIKNPV